MYQTHPTGWTARPAGACARFAGLIARGVMSDGRRFGVRPDPYAPVAVPEGSVNMTDPDSRVMCTKGQPTIQGYNAQAAVTENQIIVAAEITTASSDFGHLEPVFEAALRDLERAGASERPGVLVADAGYWRKRQMENIVANGTRVLIPPDSDLKEKPRAPAGPADSTTTWLREPDWRGPRTSL